MSLTPAVYGHLEAIAYHLYAAADAWQDNDQDAFEATPRIGLALPMSLDELAAEIAHFAQENER